VIISQRDWIPYSEKRLHINFQTPAYFRFATIGSENISATVYVMETNRGGTESGIAYYLELLALV